MVKLFMRLFMWPVAAKAGKICPGNIKQCIFLGLFLCFFSHTATAQYQLVNVLISGKRYPPSVLREAEDSHGFIWYLTHDGLYRYDGQRSLSLNPELGRLGFEGIPEEIYIDSEDLIWLATKGCVAYLDIKHWKLHKVPLGMLNANQADDLRKIEGLPDGKVIIGYKSGYALIGGRGGFKKITAIWKQSGRLGKPISYESAMYWKGAYWISTSFGMLFKLDTIKGNILNTYNLTPQNQSIIKLIPYKDQILCKAIDGKIYYFDGVRTTLMPKNDFSDASAQNILNDNVIACGKSFLYLNKRGLDTKELSVFSGDSLKKSVLFTDSAGTLSDVYINSLIYNPANGKITLGTSRGIYILYKSMPLIPQFSPFNKTTNRSVRGIYRFPNGDVFYAGYAGSGLQTTDGHTYFFKEKRAIYSIYPLNDHQLLLGTEGGFLSIFDKHDRAFREVAFTIQPRYNYPYSKFVFAICLYNGKYYISTVNGVWILDAISRTLTPLLDDKDVPVTLGLQVKRLVWSNGLLYIASQRGCYTWDNKKLRRLFPVNETVGEGIYDIAINEKGIWLATLNEGLIHLAHNGKEVERFNKENGLNTNVVFTLLNAGKLLIAGTDRGLFFIKRDSMRLLGKEDGLQQLEFNHGASFYDSQNNQAFFGGLNGYTIIDLKKEWFPKQPTKPIYVSSISISGNHQLKSHELYNLSYNTDLKIELTPWQEYVSINIATPYSYAQRYDLEYMVVGVSDYWQMLEDGQPISLLGLTAGKYKLRIRAAGDIGSDLQISIYKMPSFYQTWWFGSIMVLVLFAVTWLAYKNRMRKARQGTLLRTRIASDLHDEVGSVLTGIAMQADFLNNSGNGTNTSYLEQIAQSSREAILTMDDIVWSIDARNDNTTELVVRMRDYLIYILEPQGIQIQFDAQGNYPSIPQLIRQNIYLIFKEAINNISKHSGATEVVINVSWENKLITVRISDNGTGIKKLNKVKGQGLSNMEMRAKRMRARLLITSGKPGTVIFLEVPLKK